MRLPRPLCSVLPYLHRRDWGIGKVLYREGLSETKSSRGIAWGFGHPRWFATDPAFTTVTCTRCGLLKPFLPEGT